MSAAEQYGVTGGGPVMAIFAHPDDPEFVTGGALACWSQAGRKLVYVICTDGSKGTSDRHVAAVDLIKRRQEEQIAAARVLGCVDVVFLPYPDAYLEATLDLRREREITQKGYDLVLSSPEAFAAFIRTDTVNRGRAVRLSGARGE